MIGSGKFLDEQDLRDKYVSKPGRADSIMASCRKIVCKDTKVTFFEDMSYESRTTASCSKNRISDVDMKSEGHIKARHKVKKAMKASPNKQNKVEGELSAVAIKKLTDLKTKLTENRVRLEGLIKIADDEVLHEYLPPQAIPAVGTFANKMQLEESEVEFIVSEKKGEAAEMHKKSKPTLASCKALLKRTESLIQVARESKIELQL